MKAWQVQQHASPEEALALADIEPPEPGPGQLRVTVGAAALGLPDVFMATGTYPLTPPMPFVPGQEVAGVVAAAGDGARTPVGAHVMGVTVFGGGGGGLAEEALVYDDFAFPVPAGMPDEEAAGFLIGYHTGFLGLAQRGRLEAGETLLVLGAAGATGSAGVVLGKALGATVIAVAGGAEKAAFCARLGADHVVDHTAGDLTAQVRDVTGGRGADVVYDPVGGDAFRAAVRATAGEGRVLTVGFASGEWGTVSGAEVTMRNISVVGVYAGAYGGEFRARAHERLLDLHARGLLPSLVTRTAPFAGVPELLADLAARRVVGKAAVTVAGHR